MIRKYPIMITCAPEEQDFYRDFPLPGEELLVVPFGQAFCSVLTREVDLVLLDCGFDARFGLHLLEDLKGRFPALPVLFIVAQSSEEIVRQAFKLGARDYFKKPLPVFEVRDLMMAILAAKRDVRDYHNQPIVTTNGSEAQGHLCEFGVLQPAVMKVVCHIETHFKEAISLDQMATMANMSKYHFVRLFKSEVGMSPVRYLKFVRIQRAKELLKRRDLSVFSVALRVGFRDVSNFNKNFKSLEGCTPSQFRASLSERS